MRGRVEMKKSKNEKERLTVQDSIYDIAKEAGERIQERVLSLPNLDPKQKWLVASRVISLLFNHHFGMSMMAADEAIAREEKST